MFGCIPDRHLASDREPAAERLSRQGKLGNIFSDLKSDFFFHKYLSGAGHVRLALVEDHNIIVLGLRSLSMRTLW